ncbi:protein translocase subunit yajC [Aneurinibacillus soli]|uniref:Preprotein translocase subunit YajC n=1 Tax=Aneurinibacillus soli TaxID=1500254 RepID=A0A0U5C5B4_9BACL|nr:preprotein translocase subunit YajC [Aneurinibacillus soli]PYE62464.1 protein translocase subunit yajC [Aneurinibacillus soli]BAU27027.1 preprotein translocase subunit YajC [Aneurinibacillus soli]
MGQGAQSIILWVVMFAIFYFLLIRPNQKRQKQRNIMLGQLKKGDKVVTIGGLHGTIDLINEEAGTVVLNAGGNKLTFDKVAVQNVAGEKAAAPSLEKKEEESK